jgi:hypothetical protein
LKRFWREVLLKRFWKEVLEKGFGKRFCKEISERGVLRYGKEVCKEAL